MLHAHMADPDRHDIDDEDFTWQQGEIPGVAALAGLDPAEDLHRELQLLRAQLAAIWHELDGAFHRLHELRNKL